MKLDDRTRRSSLVLTVFVVILMLIFAGPSSAVKVEVSGLGGTHYAGVPVTFYVNVSLLEDDTIPIDNVTITGLPAGKLVFDPSGNVISDENGRYTVCRLSESTADYGYGYGYGYDEATGYGYNFGYGYGYGIADEASYLRYKIVMDTSGLSTCTDNVNVQVYSTGKTGRTVEFETSDTFKLSKRSGGGGGGGGGTYPSGWDGTPTPTVTATQTPIASATGTATAAPPGERVTPRPTITKPTATATETAAEGAAAKKPKTGLPGFTAVFAIAGLLAIAYVMMRQKR